MGGTMVLGKMRKLGLLLRQRKVSDLEKSDPKLGSEIHSYRGEFLEITLQKLTKIPDVA